MTDTPDTRTALDDAIRRHAAEALNDGEVITSWLVLAGTTDLFTARKVALGAAETTGERVLA